VANGPLLSKFSTLAETYSYAADYSYIKSEVNKEDILTFLNVLGDYFS